MLLMCMCVSERKACGRGIGANTYTHCEYVYVLPEALSICLGPVQILHACGQNSANVQMPAEFVQ